MFRIIIFGAKAIFIGIILWNKRQVAKLWINALLAIKENGHVGPTMRDCCPHMQLYMVSLGFDL